MIPIRERPPLRTDILITTPSGRSYRWGPDTPDPADAPQGQRWSSVIPGGFDTLDCRLTRRPSVDYPDLEPLSTLSVRGAGDEKSAEYRLERTPRVSGDQLAITPSAVGWQQHLEDDKSAREIYVDIDLTHWQPASVQRKINASSTYSLTDMAAQPDVASGQPALAGSFTSPWSAAPGLPLAEAWYDAGGSVDIGALYYAWKRGPNVVVSPDWHWITLLATDDVASDHDMTAELAAAGPDSGTLAATKARRYAIAQFWYDTAFGGSDNVSYDLYWTVLAVYGATGVPLHGVADATHAQGVCESDVAAHAVAKYAPRLNVTADSITPTSFVIPQLAFLDRTTAGEIVRQANRFSLNDWAVWDNRTFFLYPRGSRGRKWRARVGLAQLEETGPQVDRIWNRIVVQFTDVVGITRTVGPPGSGCDAEDASLADPDPDNPATKLGITRCDLLTMGTGSPEAAIEVGRLFLAEAKQLNTSGRATLTGYVTDDRGAIHPYWAVRAGDTIEFVDAADPSPRRIVRAECDDSQKTCQVDLDSPAEGLQALLERLSVGLVQLGLN